MSQSLSDPNFRKAWRRAVVLTDTERLFAVDGSPKVKDIARAMPNFPKSKAAWLAALVSFFNPEEGEKLARKANVNGLGALALCLPDEHRTVLSELIQHYKGW